MTEPGRMRLDHRSANEHRGAPPRHRGSCYHDVRSANVGGDHFLLAREELLGLCGCITPGAFLGLQRQLDERGPKAFYLFFGCRPHVVSANDRSQTARRGNGLKASDARAHHQGARWWHRPGRCHEQREELGEPVGCYQYRPVTGASRLRREGVHRLRPANPRYQLEASLKIYKKLMSYVESLILRNSSKVIISIIMIPTFDYLKITQGFCLIYNSLYKISRNIKKYYKDHR